MEGEEIAVQRSLSDVDPDRWNELAPRNLRFSYQWLSSVAGPFRVDSAFGLATSQEQPVGGFAAYKISAETFFLQNPPRIALADALDPLIGDFYTDEERARAHALREEVHGMLPALYPSAVCVCPFGYRVALETRDKAPRLLGELLE